VFYIPQGGGNKDTLQGANMKIKLKVKKKNKWETVKVSDLVGNTLINYIAEEFNPCAASVFDETDKVIMIVSNNKELFKFYDDSVFKILAADLMLLTDCNVGIKLAMHLDEDCEFIEVSKILPEPDHQIAHTSSLQPA